MTADNPTPKQQYCVMVIEYGLPTDISLYDDAVIAERAARVLGGIVFTVHKFEKENV